MYKYEQRRKSLEPHSSGSVKRKGTIEFKRDLSIVPKVNVQRAMGVSENSVNKNHVYIQRAEIDRRTVQFSGRGRGRGRGRGQQPQNQQPLPQPNDEEESGYEIIKEPDTLLDGQRDNILNNPEQDEIEDKDTHQKFYHHNGHYPPVGKPLWIILPDKKIEIVGMYRHGATNKIYKKNKDTGDGPNTITLK